MEVKKRVSSWQAKDSSFVECNLTYLTVAPRVRSMESNLRVVPLAKKGATMNAILETALSDEGNSFVPRRVIEYLGADVPNVSARIKQDPSDFIVEEQSTPSLRCNITTKSDLDSPYCESGSGEMIAVTLVKCRLTTEHAIKRMLDLLGKTPRQVRVSYAGLKDRWAITAQRVVIEGEITFEEVLRNCMPDMEELTSSRGSGIFIKDPIRVRKHLGMGHLVGNNFTIKVYAPGQSSSALESYIAPRIKALSFANGFQQGSFLFPNAYGRQRLGRRQNLFGVGYEFIVNGAEAGIKRFLTEVSGNEKPQAQEARRRLAREWEAAEAKAKEEGSTVARQVLHLQGMLEILEEPVGHHGAKFCEQFNMVWEHKIVSKLLETRDYERTLRAHYTIFSLWTGAYQGFWFNQVLSKVLTGEVVLEGDCQDCERQIPLFMDNPKSTKFYGKYCPEALLPRMDPLVQEVFLSTLVDGKDRHTGKPKQYHRKPPRRPLFVSVQGFKSDCRDGVATLKFMLRSGSYATTLLDILFDVEQPN